MQNFHPTSHNLLVKCDAVEHVIGGIILCEQSRLKEKATQGVVMRVGPKVKEVYEGQRVVIPPYVPQMGLQIDIGGNEYRMLRERDIVAVLE